MNKWLPESYQIILNILILIALVLLFIVLDDTLCEGLLGLLGVVYTLAYLLRSYGRKA